MTQAGADAKKIVESLLGDLRLLSTEARKKHNNVKEAAEAGLVRIRNISTASEDWSLISNLRAASSELLHPLVQACATRQTRLVQIAIQGIQRLIQHRILGASSAQTVVNELWGLVEAECEELRVLQTVPPLVSAELLVTGNALAKCIVICFRLNFAKDPIVINAASAAVRQIVAAVFERVIQEDGIFSGDLTVVTPSSSRPSPRAAPPTLRPCAADAYMLFRDLCLLNNAEPSVWLIGIHEMTRTLGLELLESLLKSYPSVFIRHSEFGTLLKDDVCPLIIRLFSPNVKSIQVPYQHPLARSVTASVSSTPGSPSDKPYFPIAMRLVRIVVILISFYHHILPTECEIFVTTLLKFVEGDRRGWQRPLALEALHRIVSRAELVRWICETFDARSNSTRVLEQIANGMATVVQQAFIPTQISSDADNDANEAQQSGNAGFIIKGVWVPYVEGLTAKKSSLLDSLERVEPSVLPEGYVLSRCVAATIDLTQAMFAAVDSLSLPENTNPEHSPNAIEVAKAAYLSTYPSLLSSFQFLFLASTDESLTDQLLCGISTLVTVGCKLHLPQALHHSLYALCCCALPSPSYLATYAALPLPEGAKEGLAELDGNSQYLQVVATGPPCPSPVVPTELWQKQVMISSRNLQAARVLFGRIAGHVDALDNFWYLCFVTGQHVSWLLAMRPSANGSFTRETRDPETNGLPVTVTTAALAEIPVLAALIDKLPNTTANMSDASLVEFFDAVIRLSDENLAVAATGRDCSLFPLAILLRMALVNLPRLPVFWAKTTQHFIRVCNHTSPSMRDWAAMALTSLIKQAMKAKTEIPILDQQQMSLSPLSAMSQIPHSEVRRRQLDCLMSLLQTEGSQLAPPIWPLLISVIAAIVEHESSCELSLVRQGYLGLRLVAADFLQQLPFESVASLVEAVAKYGRQQADQNISLSALTLLWTISDFIYRKLESVGSDSAEKVWLVLYTCLSESCVDARFAVRKSACQTMMQTITAHGHALRTATWDHIIWEIIMPLLDRVRSNTRSASTEKFGTSGNAETGEVLIMHHSRDTEAKQWIETCQQTLNMATKLYNTQRKPLLALGDFGATWEALLSYLEWAACYENAELSLSAIKSFQELLLGKVSTQTLNINSSEKTSISDTNLIDVPALPLGQWLESWSTWQRMSRGIVRQAAVCTAAGGDDKGKNKTNGPTNGQDKKAPSTYVAGPSHLTALLHIFPPLFERVARHIAVDELKFEQLPTVFDSIVNVPIPSEQVPFVLPSSASHLTPTQEALIDSIRAIYLECLSTGSNLRDALADQMRLLLKFAALGVRPLPKTTTNIGGKDQRDFALQCVVPFAEQSLRFVIEIFTTSSAFKEVQHSLVAIDIVKFLGEPLYLKYTCTSPSTWKLAAISLMSLLRIAIPLARQQGELYNDFWFVVADTIEKFLFTPNTCSRLAADERRRDELLECQCVELIRAEILPHAGRIPPRAVQRLIALLNRGSISQMDSSDVLALDSYAQRPELAKACFDALLSTSEDGDARLGHVAVASLLQRCTTVMSTFAREWAMSGDLRIPRSRITEMGSALQAIDSLIARLAKEPPSSPSSGELYAQLVSLFPSVVDLIPSSRADAELEKQLQTTLKSYQTLLLLREVPSSIINYDSNA